MQWKPKRKARTRLYDMIRNTDVEVSPGVYIPIGKIVEAEMDAWHKNSKRRVAKTLGFYHGSKENAEAVRLRYRRVRSKRYKDGPRSLDLGGKLGTGDIL